MAAISHEILVRGTGPNVLDGRDPVTDAFSDFAEEASRERLHPGLGVLYGLVLGGGLWAGIFAFVGWLRH
jgi:hypothetical protein